MRHGQTLLACVALSGAVYARQTSGVSPAAAPPLSELPPTYQPAPGARPRRHEHERRRNRWFDPRDNSLTAGGGVADFVGGSMRSAMETGAEWDVRYTISQRSLVALETGYSGTYNKMQSPVEGPGSVAPYLINHGIDSDLRLNLLPFRVQPYLFGGIGYNHASVQNLADSPAAAERWRSSDDQLLVPAGAGLALHLFTHGTFDARFTYRAIFKSELDRENPETRLDQWVVHAHMGYVF